MGNLAPNGNLDVMWENFDERVTEICYFYRTTKKDIAEKIGINPSRMSQLKRGGSPDVAFRIILLYKDINPRWLLFGQEPMIAHAPIIPYSTDDESTLPMASEGSDMDDIGHKLTDVIKTSNTDTIIALRSENDHLKKENATVWQRYDTAQQEIGRLKKVLIETTHTAKQ